MKDRCNNSKSDAYYKYGARGIKVLWKSFDDFAKDMHAAYLAHVRIHGERNTTIERTDTAGDYCKENCRWATHKEQQRNKRSNRILSFKGKKMTLAEWAETTGIRSHTIAARIDNYGYSIGDALTAKKYEYV